MEKQRLFYLLSGYAAGRLTDNEKQELTRLSFDASQTEKFEEQIVTLIQDTATEGITDKDEWAVLLKEVLAIDKTDVNDIPSGKKNISASLRFLRRWGWAAASILFLLGGGAYLMVTHKGSKQSFPQAQTNKTDFLPGRDGAILTLADGTTIVLDSLNEGIIAQQSGAQVLLNGGRLAYDPSEKGGTEIMYNTMATPKGRQFRVVLADGTGVWLNAASSIRYPTSFAGIEREVEITGEAYFEVADNADKPFIVKGRGAEVKVLGTHFNLNTYDDEENIKVTLLEGSVSVSQEESSRSLLLSPGQQLQIGPGDAVKLIQNADTDGAVSWKNGFFNFQNTSLKEVMRQLSRWYDIDIVYEKNIPNIEFVGKMDRNVTLPGLLKSLEGFGVHFRLEENRKLIVMP